MSRMTRLRADKLEEEEKKPVVSPDSTDRKKQTHLRCERQRREAINTGYQDLKELLPSTMLALGCKTTNASVLFRACEYAKQLMAEREANEQQLARLQSEQAALQIIAQQYEHLTTADIATVSSSQVTTNSPTQIKFIMFRALMDHLFESFSTQIDCSDYSLLAKTMLRWLEQIDFEQAALEMSSAAQSSS